jgi:hypothetical protein
VLGHSRISSGKAAVPCVTFLFPKLKVIPKNGRRFMIQEQLQAALVEFKIQDFHKCLQQ